MTTKEALCTTLAVLVKESGIRILELAKRVGISDRSIRGYLSGAVFPDKHIDAILEAIGVSPARFLTRAASETMPPDLGTCTDEYIPRACLIFEANICESDGP